VPSREEIVERAFEAFNRGDWALLETLWDPDGEIVGPEGWPESGTFSGWPQLLAQFKRLKDSWAEDRAEIVSHTGSGDLLSTHFRWIARGEASGVPSAVEMWMVSQFRGDRYLRASYFMDQEEADAALRGEAR
jgi:ketosteroid isomerase-like protein